MSELNPNHPVTIQSRDLWHKIVALMMVKQGVQKIVISRAEVTRFSEEREGHAVTIRFDDNIGITITLVDANEAERLAHDEGGLPH